MSLSDLPSRRAILKSHSSAQGSVMSHHVIPLLSTSLAEVSKIIPKFLSCFLWSWSFFAIISRTHVVLLPIVLSCYQASLPKELLSKRFLSSVYENDYCIRNCFYVVFIARILDRHGSDMLCKVLHGHGPEN